MSRKYGWHPDIPDHRDNHYRVQRLTAPLPPKVDLRDTGCLPSVWDQQQTSSCTVHAILAAFMFEACRQGLSYASMMPSRLYLYYNERVMEGDAEADDGAQIRDGVKSLAVDGVCDEAIWPFDMNILTAQPTMECYTQGRLHQVVQYQRVGQTLTEMKACLAEGFPVIIGFTVYESFESDQVARTGVVPMPGFNESTMGGHAVLIVGYNDDLRCWIVRNSWGDGWGLGGHFLIPYEYLTNTNLADDAWTLRLLEA